MDYRQRRKEQAQQTEQAILQAAMELARENSFDKVSVRDICQRAGITTGAFYHHFRSKEDLLSRGFSPLDRHMEEALSGHETDAPPQRLWLILSTYASFIEAQGWELVARYYQRRLDAPDDASSMDPTRYTLRAMLDCLRQAEEEGSLLPGWSVEWTADFFFRHFRGVVVDWVLHRGSYPLLPKLEQDYTLFQEIFQTPHALVGPLLLSINPPIGGFGGNDRVKGCPAGRFGAQPPLAAVLGAEMNRQGSLSRWIKQLFEPFLG